MMPAPGFTAVRSGNEGKGGVAAEAGTDTDAGGGGRTGGVPPVIEVAAGTAAVPEAGGVTPDDDVDTDAGCGVGRGGVPTEDELAGGTTTGGAGCPGPAAIDVAACCNDCETSAGLETICCKIPTHGTPPRVGFAAADGPRNGELRNIPALPSMTTTVPFLVRDICSQSFSVVLYQFR